MPTFRDDPKLGCMVPMMKTDDINDQSITKDKIRDGNVTTEKLADCAVSTDKLPDGAVSTSKIASRSVTTEKIAHNSVSRAELTPDVRTSIDKKADAEQVNNSLYDLEKKIGERFVIEGDVTNLPDEEDLTSVKESERDVLKLADRSYTPEKFSGKGYKILRRNIKPVSIAVTKIQIESAPSADGTLSFTINGKETQVAVSTTTDNTTALVAKKVTSALQESMTEYEVSAEASLINLTRKSAGSVTPSIFSASTTGVICTVTDSTKREFRNILTAVMMNQPNTIYEIRYDFDLDGETIEIPASSEVIFKGGSITNGTLVLKGNIYAKKELTLKNIKLKGCLYIITDELIYIQNCSFYTENEVFDKFSASIYVNYNNANVVIENCTFLSNRTVSNAIIVNSDINNLVITSCNISCYLRAALYSIYNIYNCKVQLNYIHDIGNLLDKNLKLYVGAYGIRISNTSSNDTYPNCNIDILSNKFERIYTYRNINNDNSECHAILLYANNVNISNNYIKDILAGESEEDINIFGGQAHEAIYVKGENPVITYNRIINGTGHCNSDGSICHKHKNTTSNISFNIIEQKFGDGIYCLADDVNISYNTITIENNYSDSDDLHIARLTAIRNISVDDRAMCKGIISNNKIVLKSRITNNMSFAIYCNSTGRFIDIFNNYICSEDKCINPFRIDCYKLDDKKEDNVIRIFDNTYIGYHTYIFSIYNIKNGSGYKFIVKNNNIKLLDLNKLPIIYNIDVPDSSFQIIGNEVIGFNNSYLLVFMYSSVSIKNLLVDGNYMDLYIKYFVESNFLETSQILFKNNILANLEFLLHSDKVNDLFFVNNFVKNEDFILLRNTKSEFTNIELGKVVVKSNFPNFSIKEEGTYTCKESFCDIVKMKGKIKDYRGVVVNNKKIITRVDSRDFDAFGVSEYMKRKDSLQKIKEAQSKESLPVGYLAINTDSNMPIIYIGDNNWLSVNGFSPEYSQKGSSDNKPQLSEHEEGFEYYDTTIKKKILWNGTSWVNLDGTELL